MDSSTTRDPYTFYRKSLLSIEEVRALSVLRPWRAVVDTIGCWLCIFAAWTAVALWPEWWVVLLAIPVIGARFYGLDIIGHDGLHRRLFPRQSTNDLFNDLFILGAIGAITRINNKNHLTHHHHLATERDPDRHKHGCFNKSNAGEFLGYLTGVTSAFRTARNIFLPRAAAVVPAQPDDPDTAPVPTAAHYTLRDFIILIGWQTALIGGLTLAIGWWAYPVLWLLPVFVFTFLADNLRSFAEHSHPEADAKADDHRLISYRSNPLERFFLSPMNMNCHAAHHLWMSIPYYNLPVADRAIDSQPEAAGIEWRGSYLAYLYRYWRALPLPDCRPRVAS